MQGDWIGGKLGSMEFRSDRHQHQGYMQLKHSDIDNQPHLNINFFGIDPSYSEQRSLHSWKQIARVESAITQM